MRTDLQRGEADGLMAVRAAPSELWPVGAVTVGGWAVLAGVGWVAHGDAWWRASEVAAAAWLCWAVQGRRALDAWRAAWRAARSPSGAPGQRGEPLGERWMRQKQTHEREGVES